MKTSTAVLGGGGIPPSGLSSHPAPRRPIDLVHLSKYTLGNRTLENELLGLFRTQAGVYLARLADASDDTEWKNAAHSLKGSARGLGAWALAELAEEAEKLLAAAEARFGVPAEIITAIIGIETIYGKHMGNYTTFAALTTLAFDYPPRAAFFRRELAELLLLAREENRPVLSYTGSYAGAMGWPQFMPSSRRKYALDFDNDGKVDLAASPVDAIGSAANFLAKHGWQTGGPIAETITLSGDGIQALIDEGIKPQRLPGEFSAQQVQIQKVGTPRVLPTGRAGDTAANHQFSDQPAALIDLITPDAPTEYRLGYQNFYVITRYNRSSFYAAAVMDLAEALKDSPIDHIDQ